MVELNEDVVFRKKPDRSKLGSLNDYYQILKVYHSRKKGIEGKEKRSFILNKLNNMPMKKIDYEYALTALKKELGIKERKK